MTLELSTPLLKFSLLGPPRIFANGTEIFITRKAVRAMANYLACQDRPTSRADLQLMFWPEASASKGATALRETLSKLRGALPDKSLLISTPTHVYFDSNFVSCDALDFLACFSKLEPEVQAIPQRSPLPEELAQRCEQALSLWTSRTFLNTDKLPSTEMFDEWLAQFGNQLEIDRNILLERMIFHSFSTGKFNKAIQYVDTLEDPMDLDEPFHYQLFDHMLASHQYGMANNYLSYLRSKAEPAGVVLEETILNQFIQILMNPMIQPASEREREWLRQFAYQLPYVGHASIMTSIQTHLGSAAGTVLTGQTGMGKTRTAYEIVRRFMQDLQLVYIEIQPMSINMPNAVIRQLLRQLLQPHQFAALPERQKEFLTPLFPELGQGNAQIPIYADIPPNEKLERLMETIQWLFCHYLPAEKFCIVLDDIHNADFTSLQIIAYLIVQKVFPAHGFIVLTGDMNLFSGWKTELVQQISHSLLTFDVQPLSMDDWEQLANSAVDRNIDRAALEILFKQSERNPLLGLTSLANIPEKRLGQNGDDPTVLSTALALPNWFQNKYEQLSPAAQAMLQFCAVLDSPVMQKHLQAAMGKPFEEILDGLDELETKQWLYPVTRPSQDLGYHFPHTLVRKKVLENLSQAKRQRLHLAIAKGLAELYKPNISPYAAVVASHYNQAGYSRQAFVYYEIAARHAVHILAPADSHRFCEEAAKIIENDIALISDDTLISFFNDWVRWNIQFNMVEEAKKHAVYMIRLGQLRDSTYLRGAGWLNKGRAESVLAIPTKAAMESINHAITLLQSIPLTLELIRAKLLKASYFSHNNQFDAATELCEEILSTPNPDPDRVIDYRYFMNITKYILGTIYQMQANLTGADQLFEQFYTKETLTYSAFTDIQYRNWHLNILFDTGQTKEVLQKIQQVQADAEALGNESMLAQVCANLAQIYHQMGRNDTALALITKGVPYAEKYNITHLLVDYLITQGDAMLTWGDTASATKLYQKALQTAKGDSLPTTLNKAAIPIALMEGRNGNIEKAVRMTKAIMRVFQTTGNEYLFLQTQMQLFHLCISQEKDDCANDVSRDEIVYFLEGAKQKGLALWGAHAHFLLAQYDFLQGTNSNALRELHTAINLYQKFELHMDELKAYQLLSQHAGLTVDDQTRVISLLANLEKTNQHESIRTSAHDCLSKISTNIV